MFSNNDREKCAINNLSPSEIYDSYAPAVYGKILSIVHEVPIAEKILEKVFVASLNDKTVFNNTLLTPLITLLNQSRKKSDKIIKALNIFNECCAGATVCIADKK